MLITLVAGARPNFMKIAPIIRAIEHEQSNGTKIEYNLVHTGQHYDKKMSEDFFDELRIPKPTVNLGAGGGTQSEQTAAIMVSFEKFLIEHPPTAVLVVGDVTSTLACAIVSKKLQIPVIHVEAGIRSGDMSMPEEINRIVTDSITDHFFTTSEDAGANLVRSGAAEDQIHFVGNTMIDSLLSNLDRLKQPTIWTENKLQPKDYFLVTLHRPSNVDDPEQLKLLLDTITKSAGDKQIIFPVHPRTKQKLEDIKYSNSQLIQTEPMSYLEFIYLVKNTLGIITDSGGITEEATVLDIPCLTMRDSTERPETVSMGSNELIGSDPEKLSINIDKIIDGKWKTSQVPPLWDGKTSTRIVTDLIDIYS